MRLPSGPARRPLHTDAARSEAARGPIPRSGSEGERVGARQNGSARGAPGGAARRARWALARRLDGIAGRWAWVGRHHHAAEQDALRQLAMAAATESGWGAVPGLAARVVADLLGVSEALVCQFESEGARVVARSGGPSADEGPDTIPLTPGSPLWLVAGALRPVRVEGAGAAAPVRANDRVWGAIVAGTMPSGQVPPGPSSAWSGSPRWCRWPSAPPTRAHGWPSRRRRTR